MARLTRRGFVKTSSALAAAPALAAIVDTVEAHHVIRAPRPKRLPVVLSREESHGPSVPEWNIHERGA